MDSPNSLHVFSLLDIWCELFLPPEPKPHPWRDRPAVNPRLSEDREIDRGHRDVQKGWNLMGRGRRT